MTITLIREIAAEFKYEEISAESDGLISFAKKIAKGRIRVNYWDNAQLLFLSISKEQKGFHNFKQTYPTIKYNLVYEIFKHPNRFRRHDINR
jgi:hypothetical protein